MKTLYDQLKPEIKAKLEENMQNMQLALTESLNN
jgi:hypothetical protein